MYFSGKVHSLNSEKISNRAFPKWNYHAIWAVPKRNGPVGLQFSVNRHKVQLKCQRYKTADYVRIFSFLCAGHILFEPWTGAFQVQPRFEFSNNYIFGMLWIEYKTCSELVNGLYLFTMVLWASALWHIFILYSNFYSAVYLWRHQKKFQRTLKMVDRIWKSTTK